MTSIVYVGLLECIFLCLYLLGNRINLAIVSTARVCSFFLSEMWVGIGKDLRMLVNKIGTLCFS